MDRASGTLLKKLALAATFVIAVVAGYVLFGDALTLENLAEREAQLKEFQREHPILVYGIAFAIYVTVTGLSLPGALVLTLACGWFFGFWRSMVLVSFASTTGATVAFLVSRYVLREPIQNRFGERLAAFNRALEREGAFYLFMLRLIPAVPFFVINVVMALTPLKARTFWWVSQVGMLPGTAVYVYAGSSVPELGTLAEQGLSGIVSWQLLVAFTLLGIMPLVLRRLLMWIRPGAALRVVSEDGPTVDVSGDAATPDSDSSTPVEPITKGTDP